MSLFWNFALSVWLSLGTWAVLGWLRWGYYLHLVWLNVKFFYFVFQASYSIVLTTLWKYHLSFILSYCFCNLVNWHSRIIVVISIPWHHYYTDWLKSVIWPLFSCCMLNIGIRGIFIPRIFIVEWHMKPNFWCSFIVTSDYHYIRHIFINIYIYIRL